MESDKWLWKKENEEMFYFLWNKKLPNYSTKGWDEDKGCTRFELQVYNYINPVKHAYERIISSNCSN